MNNGNNPANPLTGDAYIDFYMYDETKGGASSYNPKCQGLTKREHFAGLIIPSVITKFAMITGQSDEIAELSVKLADALLKGLAK